MLRRAAAVAGLVVVWLAVAGTFAVLAVVAGTHVIANLDSGCRDWRSEFAESQRKLPGASTSQKFYLLGDAAKAAFESGDLRTAEAYARELLVIAPAFRNDWNYGNAIHDTHVVLGRIALARGDREAARRELLLAGDTPGSPQLNSFGPNMSLARDLLRAGERDVVFEYFDQCRRFWAPGDARMRQWERMARLGLPPYFGANLLF